MKRIIRFIAALLVFIPWIAAVIITAIGEYAFQKEPDWEYWRSYHSNIARMLTFQELK